MLALTLALPASASASTTASAPSARQLLAAASALRAATPAADVTTLSPRDPMLLGSDPGAVRVVRHRGSRWVRLTDRGARRYKRGRIALNCHYANAEGREQSTSGGVDAALEPRVRLRVDEDAAYCTVDLSWRRTRSSTSQFRLATLAFTKPGGELVARRQAAAALLIVVMLAEDEDLPVGTRRMRSPGEIAKQLGIDALDGPGVAVAEGRIGVWTDGDRRIYVTTTLRGKRLYLDANERTDEFATNVASALGDAGAF
ncbi:hypothetical protein [Patulibacter defluvii]|uniref:hypothetical protein n=1 Tax=Patulibacter defluvii TaxID=3095358 RepID=UPI002A74733C|nr:hypothetical protein [Patulibacter sp. DM4]